MKKLLNGNKKKIYLLGAGFAAVILVFAFYFSPMGHNWRNEMKANEFIGLSDSEAREKAVKEGLTYREFNLDASPQFKTDDFVRNRINVYIRNDKVVEASFDKD